MKIQGTDSKNTHLFERISANKMKNNSKTPNTK